MPLQHVHYDRIPPRPKHMGSYNAPCKAITAHRQIHPYRDRKHRDDRYPDLSIFQTSRQIQAEAEPVFYGSASFNLMGPWSNEHFQSFEFFQRLPQRYRKLIKHVEHYHCFVQCIPQYDFTPARYDRFIYIPTNHFDWQLFMKFLAQECPNLQSLKLWVWTDRTETQELRRTTSNIVWVQGILRLAHLTNLPHFDMPAIKSTPTEHPVEQTPSGDGGLLPSLRRRLLQVRLQASKKSASMALHDPHNRPRFNAPFPFLKLPLSVRALVYRYVLLPPNNQIHPFIKSWHNISSRNVVALLSTCRFICQEAEDVLYGEAIFTVPGGSSRYACGLRRFFETVGPRLRAKVRYVTIPSYGFFFGTRSLVHYLAENMDSTSLTYFVPEGEVQRINLYWRRAGHKMFDKDWRRWLGLFNNLNIRTSGENELEPKLRRWLQRDLKEERIARQRRRDTLRIRPKAAVS